VRRPGEGRPAACAPGVRSSLVLFESPHERVVMEEWAPDADIEALHEHGLELLVLSGSFSNGRVAFEPLSWLRLPGGSTLKVSTGPEGARVWFKSAKPLLDQVCQFQGSSP